MSSNYGLELYKLIVTPDEIDFGFSYVSEFGWINDNEFCIWVNYCSLNEFMDRLIDIFGYGMFDDGGFNGNMQSDCACIDLCEALEGYMDIEEIEEVFPKDKYQH